MKPNCHVLSAWSLIFILLPYFWQVTGLYFCWLSFLCSVIFGAETTGEILVSRENRRSHYPAISQTVKGRDVFEDSCFLSVERQSRRILHRSTKNQQKGRNTGMNEWTKEEEILLQIKGSRMQLVAVLRININRKARYCCCSHSPPIPLTRRIWFRETRAGKLIKNAQNLSQSQ